MDLTKDANELYSENYETIGRNWRSHKEMESYCMLMSEKISFIEIAPLPKAIYKLKNRYTN